MEIQNQNSEQKQTINIEIPTATNIAGRRPLIPLSFAIAIIFFFFTFCDFKCGGQKIGSVTGINLVTGTEIKNRDIISGQELKGKEIPSSIWAILAFGAAIVGLGAFVIKEKRETIIGTGAGIVGVCSLIILQYFIKDTLAKEAHGQVETELQFPYWGALFALGIAGYISFLRLKKKYNVVVNVSTSTPYSPVAEFDSKAQITNSFVSPKSHEEIPNPTTKRSFRLASKKTIIILGTLLLVLGAGYFVYDQFFSQTAIYNRKFKELFIKDERRDKSKFAFTELIGTYHAIYTSYDRNEEPFPAKYIIRLENKGCGLRPYAYYVPYTGTESLNGYIFAYDNGSLGVGGNGTCGENNNYGSNNLLYDPDERTIYASGHIFQKD